MEATLEEEELLELCGGVRSLPDASWLAIGAEDGSPEAPTVAASASPSPRRRTRLLASASAPESAARCSAGLSAAGARRGELGGALEWDVTIETQATGVRLGVCRGDERSAEFSTNSSLVLLGCGSGQRFLHGDWVTAGAVAARNAIPTGGSATFTIDFRRAHAGGDSDGGDSDGSDSKDEEASSGAGGGGDDADADKCSGALWVSVQGRARRRLAGGLGIAAASAGAAAADNAEVAEDEASWHPACFLRTGDRAFSASAPRAVVGFPAARVAALLQLLEARAGPEAPVARARDCLGRSALATACDAAAPLAVLEALARAHPAAAAGAGVDQRLPLHRLCAALALDGADAEANVDADADVEARFAAVHAAHPAAAAAADEDGRLPLHSAAACGAGLALVACCQSKSAISRWPMAGRPRKFETMSPSTERPRKTWPTPKGSSRLGSTQWVWISTIWDTEEPT